MCWSLLVTGCFVLADLLCLKLLMVAKQDMKKSLERGLRWDCYFVFVSLYTVMELLQFVQWIILSFEYECGTLNVLTTYIAYMLIWLQPVMFSVFVFWSCEIYYGMKSTAFLIFYMSYATFLFAMFSILIGNNSSITEGCYSSLNTNYNVQTCTKIGENNHLHWNFNVMTLQYQPTHFVYMLLICSALLIVKNYTFLVLGVGWVLSLITSALLIGTGPELPAFWCLLSVFANIPILVDVYSYQLYNLRNKFSKMY